MLLDVMRRHGCKNIIFSSSATVYGNPAVIPITEDCPKGKCTNPYGQTKSMLEEILTDMHTADVKNGDPNPWNVVLLRYFRGFTQERTARALGVSQVQISRIERRAVGRLRELLEER